MTSDNLQLRIDVSRTLRSSLEAAAERAGVSLSEYLRDALLRQLVADECVSDARPKFGPETLLRIEKNLHETFGDQVLPDDSTDLIREARGAPTDECEGVSCTTVQRLVKLDVDEHRQSDGTNRKMLVQ